MERHQPVKPQPSKKSAKKEKDEVLDDSLEDSFPASDPPAVTQLHRPKPATTEAPPSKKPS